MMQRCVVMDVKHMTIDMQRENAKTVKVVFDEKSYEVRKESRLCMSPTREVGRLDYIHEGTK